MKSINFHVEEDEEAKDEKKENCWSSEIQP